MARRTVLCTSLVAVALLTSACERCGSATGGERPGPPSAAASASIGTAPSVVPPLVRHRLAPRAAPDLDALRAARPRVTSAVERARALSKQEDGIDSALALLASVRGLDPLGAGLALEVSRVAKRESPRLSERWADEAQWLAEGRPELEELAASHARALRGGTTPETPRSTGVTLPHTVAELEAACRAIQTMVRRGEVSLRGGGGSPLGDASCEPESSIVFENPRLSRATALRVKIAENGERALAFLALHAPDGIRVRGPLADIWNPTVYRLTNDFAQALERVDALPGGAPEVVLRISERRTLPDLVLNELVSLEQTRIVLISLDRGRLDASRPFVLARRVEREPIDAAGSEPPPGLPRPPAHGRALEFRMKVRWGENELELSRESGELEPPLQGRVALFE